MLIFERSSLLGRALFGFLGGLAGLGGFLAGLGGRKYAPENGFRGVGGFGFRKGWEGFGFRGVGGFWLSRGGGFGFRKGWGRLDAWACLGLGRLGLGRLDAWACLGLGRLGLGVACYLSFCRLVLYAKPTTFAIVKTKATPPRGECYGSTQTLTIIINLKTQKNNYGSILS